GGRGGSAGTRISGNGGAGGGGSSAGGTARGKTTSAPAGFRSRLSTCWRSPWIISSIWRICSLDLLIQMSRGSACAPGALIGSGCGRAIGAPGFGPAGCSQSAAPPKTSSVKMERPTPRIRYCRCFGDSRAIAPDIRFPGDSGIGCLQDDHHLRRFPR
ncbi:MAG TPA: hypothetical protein DGC76_00095, partial [Candidatus Accumulibacter sp.]|nr:hypothetical protein [Accumulibacter sp.]